MTNQLHLDIPSLLIIRTLYDFSEQVLRLLAVHLTIAAESQADYKSEPAAASITYARAVLPERNIPVVEPSH